MKERYTWYRSILYDKNVDLILSSKKQTQTDKKNSSNKQTTTKQHSKHTLMKSDVVAPPIDASFP